MSLYISGGGISGLLDFSTTPVLRDVIGEKTSDLFQSFLLA